MCQFSKDWWPRVNLSSANNIKGNEFLQNTTFYDMDIWTTTKIKSSYVLSIMHSLTLACTCLTYNTGLFWEAILARCHSWRYKIFTGDTGNQTQVIRWFKVQRLQHWATTAATGAAQTSPNKPLVSHLGLFAVEIKLMLCHGHRPNRLG